MRKSLNHLSGPFFALGLITLVTTCLTLASSHFVPIAIAFFVWIIINAFAATLLSALGPRSWFPAWLAKLIAILCLFLTILIGVQLLAENVAELSRDVSSGEGSLLAQIQNSINNVGIRWGLSFEDVVDRLKIETVIAWGLKSVQNLISDVSLIFLYVLFLLVDERYFLPKLRALIPDKARREKLQGLLRDMTSDIRLYLWLMSLISLGVALATYFLCKLVGLDGASFWAFLAFTLNFVPTIGSIAAVVLPVIFALLTLNDLVSLSILIVGLSATQFIAGELVLPRVMGDRLNLSSFVIMLMLVAWGAMWGAAGVFLAIPMTVIIVMIFAKFETTRPLAILLSKDGKIASVDGDP